RLCGDKDNRIITAVLKTLPFENVSSGEVRGGAGRANADFSTLKLLEIFDLWLRHQALHGGPHREDDRLDRLSLDGRSNYPSHRHIVVDISSYDRRAGESRGHKNELNVEALLFVVTVVFCGVEGQVCDVGGRNRYPNFLKPGLRL